MNPRLKKIRTRIETCQQCTIIEDQLARSMRMRIREWATTKTFLTFERKAKLHSVSQVILLFTEKLGYSAWIVLIGNPEDGFAVASPKGELRRLSTLIIDEDQPFSLVSFDLQFACTLDFSIETFNAQEGELFVTVRGRLKEEMIRALNDALGSQSDSVES